MNKIWKIYFWVLSILATLGAIATYSLGYLNEFKFIDILDIASLILITIMLYSFSYQKKILSKSIMYLLAAYIIFEIILSIIPLINDSFIMPVFLNSAIYEYSGPIETVSQLIVGFGLSLPIYYALYKEITDKK